MSTTSVSPPPPASGEEAVERARALFPLIREHALAAEHARHLPAEIIDAIVEAGLVRTMVPKRYGGLELGLEPHLDIAIELGRAYGAAGWVGSFLIDHGLVFAHFPRGGAGPRLGNARPRHEDRHVVRARRTLRAG